MHGPLPPAGEPSFDRRRYAWDPAQAGRFKGVRAPPSGDEPVDGEPAVEDVLREQRALYRAVAGEYEQHGLGLPGGKEVEAALERFRPAGDVLELAPGPGLWTGQLLRHATAVTAVDASAEMLALLRRRLRGRVRTIQADLFSWSPDRRYDVVFFGFWLSHVPLERFDAFWSLVRECLKPEGRVFFVDDAYRTAAEMVFGEASWTVRRRLRDGTAYRIVKVSHQPADLQQRLAALGWRIRVEQTSGPFYWGAGAPASLKK